MPCGIPVQDLLTVELIIQASPYLRRPPPMHMVATSLSTHLHLHHPAQYLYPLLQMLLILLRMLVLYMVVATRSTVFNKEMRDKELELEQHYASSANPLAGLVLSLHHRSPYSVPPLLITPKSSPLKSHLHKNRKMHQ